MALRRVEWLDNRKNLSILEVESARVGCSCWRKLEVEVARVTLQDQWRRLSPHDLVERLEAAQSATIEAPAAGTKGVCLSASTTDITLDSFHPAHLFVFPSALPIALTLKTEA